MASTSPTPLKEQLRDAGINLLHSPSSVEELLALLDKAEDLLFKVDQALPLSFKDALLPMMKALKSETLLKHPEAVVRVSVASCIHEITRITAPLEPYDDELMKEIFKLTVSCLEKLSQPSTRCYEKVASILSTIACVRSCVVMLDLRCDDLVIEMFRNFLKTTGSSFLRSNHTEDVLWAMERIMTLVLEESEDISMELLELLLTSVRNVNQNFGPISWKLGVNVISSCTKKLRPVLKNAVQSSAIALDEYAPVIASICGSLPDKTAKQGGVEALPVASALVGAKLGLDAPLPVIEAIVTGEDCSSKIKSFNLLDADNAVNLGPQSEISMKRDRRPNSLMNSEEGYEHFCGLRNRKCRLNNPYERPKPEGSQEKKRRRFSRKTQNTIGPAVVSPETASDEEGELLVGCKERQPSQPPNREEAGPLLGMDSKRKKRSVASDKKKLEVSGKKKVGKSASKLLIKDEVSSERTIGTGLKRKQTPRKEKESDQHDIGEEVVGQRIKVWWPRDKVFYDGIVRSYDPKRKRHQVVYTDGVEERLNLKKQRWKLVEDETPSNEDAANHKHNEPSEVSRSMKKKGRPKLTKDSYPYRLVKRAGALSSLIKIEPSDGYIEDETVVAANNVGNVAQIDGTGVEDAKISLTEQNSNLSCSEGPEG